LPALETPTPARVRTAREAAIKAVEASPVATNEAVLLMSALGELDTAFAIADATLIARGPLVQRAETAAAPTRSALWRTATQWMWAPPVAVMRADPRFLPLCAEVGLTDYWGIRGVKPDYLSTGK
jgi:hypothetical protein